MTTTPNKSEKKLAGSGNGKNAMPSHSINVRHHQVILQDNSAIPDSRMETTKKGGRQIALDVKTVITPVMTSARKPKVESPEEDIFSVLRGMENMSLDTGKVSPKTFDQAASSEVKKQTKKKSKTKKDTDEDWVAVEESESYEAEERALLEEYYDVDDADELDWALSTSGSEDSEEDARFCAWVDPFSPERAKGMVEYTVPNSKNGSVQSVKRSARNSLGSPTRLSFGSSPSLVPTSTPP